MKQDGSGSKEKDSLGNDIPLPAWELITLFVLMLRVSIDHVVPLALGMGAYGQQCVTNMQLLCTKCNVTKVRVVLSLAHSTLLIYFYIHRKIISMHKLNETAHGNGMAGMISGRLRCWN